MLKVSKIIMLFFICINIVNCYEESFVMQIKQSITQTNERYLVHFKHKVSKNLPSGTKIKLRLKTLPVISVELSANALNALQKNTNIEYIEKDVKRYMFAEQVPYGIPMVQADQLSDESASGIKVCVIDSGIHMGHEDLPNISNINGTSDVGTGPWYEDGDGHGTHVSGTIAAIGGNNIGVVGILPNGNVQLHIVRVFGDDGIWTYSSTLVRALEICQENGSRIVNMSLGGPFKSRTEDKAFKKAFDNGMLSIAAAGNGGNTRKSYPASYDSVISVAAVDQNMQHASFSQQNSQVELAASGVGILSTVPSGYAYYNGTSMSTPHVVGVAALVWSQNTSWTNSEIRTALQLSALDLGESGKDNMYGYGLVQAKSAYDYLMGNQCVPSSDIEIICDDGIDNDCDGNTDDLDEDCNVVCDGLSEGDSCINDSECCSGKCKGKPSFRVCR